MLLMIDNYDSFTWNLVRYFRELKQDVLVFRNDAISLEQIQDLNPQGIIISPGPGTPDDAGISLKVIQELGPQLPILGVCLGCQALAQAHGARIVRAEKVMHGKLSSLHHQHKGVFNSLPPAFNVVRYHSLIIEQATLPPCLEMTAWTETTAGAVHEIMAVCHRDYPLQGVQFHPESVLTEQGHQLLANFIQSYL